MWPVLSISVQGTADGESEATDGIRSLAAVIWSRSNQWSGSVRLLDAPAEEVAVRRLAGADEPSLLSDTERGGVQCVNLKGRRVHALSCEPAKHESDRPCGVAEATVRCEDGVAEVRLARPETREIGVRVDPPDHLRVYHYACGRLRVLVARTEPSSPLIVPALKEGGFILRLERSKGDLTVAEDPFVASWRDSTHTPDRARWPQAPPPQIRGSQAADLVASATGNPPKIDT